jgi:hypothetical protein
MVEVDEYAACFGAELSPLFDPLPHDDRGVAQSLHAATDACLFAEEELIPEVGFHARKYEGG